MLRFLEYFVEIMGECFVEIMGEVFVTISYIAFIGGIFKYEGLASSYAIVPRLQMSIISCNNLFLFYFLKFKRL
jgi:hypothetical protein